MDWQGHALLGLRAAQGLPQWEIDALQTSMAPEEIRQPFMPPITSVREKLGAYCLILDWIYQPEYARYTRHADGQWIPHGPVKNAGGGISVAGNNELIEQLMGQLIVDLRTSQWDEAVRHAGVLAHFLQEPFTPGHSYDNALFSLFFPDPNPQRHISLHKFFDCASGDYPPPTAKLVGRSSKEAAFYLFNYIQWGIRSAAATVPLVVAAAYRGGSDPQQSEPIRKALLNKQSEMAASVTANAWHTAFCIAFEHFEDDELLSLENCDLLSVPPYFWHPSHYDFMQPGCLVNSKNGQRCSIEVWDKAPNGAVIKKIFQQGFGIYGHCGVKFFLNDLFSKIRFKLGMAACYLHGQSEFSKLNFTVEIDDKENTVYSEDIEYTAKKRVYSVDLYANEPLREIELDISGAKTLIFSSRATPHLTQEGEMLFDVPDLAIIDPILIP